jgi:16S rRNA (cytosine1402-N4)-methyltransferase
MSEEFHRPVLVKELIELLRPEAGQVIVDLTIGGGGHAEAILEALGGQARLIGIDRDPEAIRFAGERLSRFGAAVHLLHGRFSHLAELLDQLGIEKADRIYADLGVSAHQLESAERGFSFMREGPLDMRMDQQEGEPASKVLQELSMQDLEKIFREYGEERFSRRVAKAIERKRRQGLKLGRTRELAGLVEAEVRSGQRVHPATRIFQALRIYVNEEIAELREGLKGAAERLEAKGRMAVISYHSLEDREVKQFFRAGEKAGELNILTRKPLVPAETELRANPRSRSAKLRAAEKI